MIPICHPQVPIVWIAVGVKVRVLRTAKYLSTYSVLIRVLLRQRWNTTSAYLPLCTQGSCVAAPRTYRCTNVATACARQAIKSFVAGGVLFALRVVAGATVASLRGPPNLRKSRTHAIILARNWRASLSSHLPSSSWSVIVQQQQMSHL